VGLAPLKVNMVVKKGDNDDQLVPMARHFRGSGIILRFIEYMDVGETNHWDMTSVVPSAEVIQRLSAEFPLEPLSSNYTGETAERWRYADGAGEIGVISSVTHAFCHDCTRARLSTEGKLYLCLFATEGFDLRTLLRNGTTDLELSNVIRAIWQGRTDRYSELRASGQAHPAGRRIEMSYIGG
jgi:cyclic pyranopterin phosphate synthase